MRKGNFAEDRAKEYLGRSTDYHLGINQLINDLMLEQNVRQVIAVVYGPDGVAVGLEMFSAYFANLVHSKTRSLENPLELGPACQTFNIAEIDRILDLTKGEVSKDNPNVTVVPFKLPYIPRRPDSFGWNVFQSNLQLPLDRWLGEKHRCAHFCHFIVVKGTFYLCTPGKLKDNEIQALQVMKVSDSDRRELEKTERLG